MIRKFIYLLILFPMLVFNFTPTSTSASGLISEISYNDDALFQKISTPENKSERKLWTFFADAIFDAEVEEKIKSSQFQRYPLIVSRYGYALRDLFAIPSERLYLLDEPPIL